MLACLLMVSGCVRSLTPEAARQRELAAILKPFLTQTEISDDGYSEMVPNWRNRANQNPLRVFIAQHPETEEAYEAEIWLSMATAPTSTETFEKRRVQADIAEKLKTISQKTSCPGTKKMAELEGAFTLYQDSWPGDHTAFYQQADDILVRIADFQSEKSGLFRLYLQATEMKPSDIEPTLRLLVVREKCFDHQQTEALALARELKHAYPNWEPRSVNSQIEMIELFQRGWTLQPNRESIVQQ